MILYDVIYADPPWRYDFTKSDSRKIENQYPTMDVEDIKALEVPSADDAALFLWATAPKLREALEVMVAWGFEYKTHAIWDKKRIGMGYWFRGQHELLLVGTKGKFSPPKIEQRIGSVFREKRKAHSSKPDMIRSFLSQWYPESRRLELFARNWIEGWDVLGDEIPDTMQKVLVGGVDD